ncbi:hypothetical protein [Streptomyces sp. col6]|uniref:hypothetical protein n=1 Tax=Streptomyces sp. col6 TaxID=2478958 RepID=UPI001745F880|nr:hypothetical protein [Streptomyces sp. col6]
MTEANGAEAERRSFLAYVRDVARLPGFEGIASGFGAAHVAHAVRRPLLERAYLPEELFAPLTAAAVRDPDPSFCRWFAEPAVWRSDAAG